MSIRKIIFFTIIFAQLSSNLLAQWSLALSLKDIPNIMGVAFSSRDSGIYSFYKSVQPPPHTNSYSGLVHTTDGGKTWNSLGSCSYPCEANIYTMGEANNVFPTQAGSLYSFSNNSSAKSNDGGLNWEGVADRGGKQLGFSAPEKNYAYFLNHDFNDKAKRIILSKSSSLWHIDSINSFISSNACKIFFPDSLNGYVCISDTSLGRIHTILKTIDGGTSWSTSLYDPNIQITKLFFLSALKGFAATSKGVVLKTVDGGVNWQYISINNNYTIKDMVFLNDTLGYLSIYSSIYQSTDAGLSWHLQTIPSAYNGTIYQFMIARPDALYAYQLNSTSGGPNLLIMYPYSNTGINSVIGKSENIFISPNPCRGNFTLSIPAGLTMSENVNIEMYNSLGQLVQYKLKVIDNEHLEIYLEDPSTGFYACCLKCRDGVFYKKIIIE